MKNQIPAIRADIAEIKRAIGLLAQAPAPSPLPAPPATEPALPALPATTIRGYIAARRLRDRYMPPDLFADPAWDILLDLYAAESEGRSVSVSSACTAAAVPHTTALRHIGALVDRGAIERRPDPADRRRHFLHLTATARGTLDRYFAEVACRSERAALPTASIYTIDDVRRAAAALADDILRRRDGDIHARCAGYVSTVVNALNAARRAPMPHHSFAEPNLPGPVAA